MTDGVARRIVQSQSFVTKAKEAFQLSELDASLHASIWSELKSGREITPMRRNLQREHLRRVTASLLRPSPTTPADARSLHRMDALALAAEVKVAQSKAGFCKEPRRPPSETPH